MMADDTVITRDKALECWIATRHHADRGLDQRSTQATTTGDHQEEEEQRLVARNDILANLNTPTPPLSPTAEKIRKEDEGQSRLQGQTPQPKHSN